MRKLKVQEKLEAHYNHLVPIHTKDQHLKDICSNPEYQPPCDGDKVTYSYDVPMSTGNFACAVSFDCIFLKLSRLFHFTKYIIYFDDLLCVHYVCVLLIR